MIVPHASTNCISKTKIHLPVETLKIRRTYNQKYFLIHLIYQYSFSFAIKLNKFDHHLYNLLLVQQLGTENV